VQLRRSSGSVGRPLNFTVREALKSFLRGPPGGHMKPCRECRHQISEQAFTCPQCGAPYPARESWDGWGYEYKSKATIAGLPLVHISFKYRANRTPVVARGIIAIGQFACGVVCIGQFSVGVLSISQFTLAGYAVAQFALAYSLIAQFGLYLSEGHGQLVFNLSRLFGVL
jgi:hypothetical protein